MYDEDGTLAETDTETVTGNYDEAGNLLSETTVYKGKTETAVYTYDNRGLVLSETADGVTTEYRYDANGYETYIKTVEEEKETVVSYTYNVIGQVVTQTENGLITDYVYDLSGNAVKTIQSDGIVTHISRVVYDSDNRIIQKISDPQYSKADDGLTPDDNRISAVNVYHNENVGERYTYDDKGNITTYVNTAGNKTVNTYDSKDRLVKTVIYETSEDASDDLTTRYVYNTEGNLIQTVYPHQYRAENDSLDVSADINSYADRTVGDRYTYDEDGNVLTYTNRYGEVTTNTYDEDGSLTSVAKTKADGAVFTFDDENRAEKETYANGLVREYTYASDHTTVTGSNRVTAVYTQNAFGDITEYTLKNGDSSKKYTYTYDSDGNITTISLNGSLQQTFTYNLSGELVRVDDKTADETVTYEYDYVGNITKVQNYSYTTGEPGIPKTTKTYTYNSQNQRTDLSYDANGNITSLNGYTFGWANRRLSSATSTDNGISYTYNYDGIRTGKTVNGKTTYCCAPLSLT